MDAAAADDTGGTLTTEWDVGWCAADAEVPLAAAAAADARVTGLPSNQMTTLKPENFHKDPVCLEKTYAKVNLA